MKMNKERLEKIEKELELDWYNISNVVNQDDVKWLINRIKGLEEERDEWKDIAQIVQSNYIANQEIREQIKRYYKAINNTIKKAMSFGTNMDGNGENLQKGCRTMIQIYCNDENGVNKWLREHQDVEIIDIKMAMNNDGEFIMVIYKTNGNE